MITLNARVYIAIPNINHQHLYKLNVEIHAALLVLSIHCIKSRGWRIKLKTDSFFNGNGCVCDDVYNLLSRANSRFPCSDLSLGSAVSSEGAASTSEVGSRFGPPLLRLNAIHGSRRFLDDSCQPHMPIIIAPTHSVSSSHISVLLLSSFTMQDRYQRHQDQHLQNQPNAHDLMMISYM